MLSGLIGKNSPLIDVLEVLTGQYDERSSNGWEIVQCPFFTVFTATVDKGSKELPFTVTVPTPALLYGKSGAVKALVIKPNDTAVNATEAGIVQVQVFGGASRLKAVR
jgi:hypothetical protein